MTSFSCFVIGEKTQFLTKADKLKRGPATSTLLKVRKSLPDSASVQVFSAMSRDGLEEWVKIMTGWFAYEQND